MAEDHPQTPGRGQSRQAEVGLDRDERHRVLLAFGKNLRAQRRGARLSQRALALRCFMHHDQISAIERGARRTDIPDLLALACSLGASVEQLTRGLRAPVRQTGTDQVRRVIARRPGVSTDSIADSLNLPIAYVAEIALYLEVTDAIVSTPTGWSLAESPLGASAGSQRDTAFAEPASARPLTPRETEVLECLSKGETYAEIALSLHITYETARTHTRRIRRKLGVDDRRSLIGVDVTRLRAELSAGSHNDLYRRHSVGQ
jgi:DNA-binding CsgD family transcriptional regulator/transcriptional regulator with XRE-family HTH domain